MFDKPAFPTSPSQTRLYNIEISHDHKYIKSKIKFYKTDIVNS